MKTLLVVNPAAGHGKGKKCFERLEPALARKDARASRSASPNIAGHAVEIGRQAAGEGFDRLICLGGDGTPFEVIDGLYAEGRPANVPEIGLIPAGTGNSFIRDFGTLTPEEALGNILAGRRPRGRPRRIRVPGRTAARSGGIP